MVIFSIFFACYDNFDSTIKDENKNTNKGTTEINSPVVSFASSASSTSNEDAIAHSIDIILSHTSDNTVTITVTDLKTGSAAYSDDYNYTGWSSPQVITFNPGDTIKTISITPMQDAINESPGEIINLQLSSPANAVLGAFIHTMTITDDDGSEPVVSFASSASSTSYEDAIAHSIDIILSQTSGNTVTVTIEDLKTGSATYAVDYNYTGWNSPEIITFNPGDSKKTIYITPLQDSIYEGSGESINLRLSSPTNAVLGAFIHTMTITDDDSPGSSWVQVGNVATSRAGSAVALSGNYLYIYGGETSSGILGEFLRYNLSTGSYTTLSNAPGPRAYATLSELNGRLYLFGGVIDTSGTLYNDKNDGVYYYDTASGTWSSFKGSDTTGTFAGARAYHVAVPIYNSSGPVEDIYLHGGDISDGILHKIDLTTSKYKWQTPQYKISYTRSMHSAVYYNNNIYFFGGYDGTTYHNDLWGFNVTSNSFSEIITIGVTIIPVRSGISMIEYNGKLYVFGGRNGTACLDDLWSYSISGNTWTKISTAPFKRCFYSAVRYNNSLIIFGGYYLNGTGQKVYSSDLWQYPINN